MAKGNAIWRSKFDASLDGHPGVHPAKLITPKTIKEAPNCIHCDIYMMKGEDSINSWRKIFVCPKCGWNYNRKEVKSYSVSKLQQIRKNLPDFEDVI